MKILSRLLSSRAIDIRKGKAVALKGKFSHHELAEIGSTAELNKISSGEIWISSIGKVTFSSEIPESKQQQFRNTLINI